MSVLAALSGEAMKHLSSCVENVMGDMLLGASEVGDLLTCEILVKNGVNVNYTRSLISGEKHIHIIEFLLKELKGTTFELWSLGMMKDMDTFVDEVTLGQSLSYCGGCLKLEKSGKLSDIDHVFMHFVRSAKSPLLTAYENRCMSVCKFLLESGADVGLDLGRSWKYSVFHWNVMSAAICNDDTNAVSLFVKYTTNVNHVLSTKVVFVASQNVLQVLLCAGLHRDMLVLRHDVLSVFAGRDGPKVPDDLLEREKPCSLQFLCRQLIRNVVCSCNVTNFFVCMTTKNLRVPKRICQYLRCEF